MIVVEAYMIVVLEYMKMKFDQLLNVPFQSRSSLYLVVASWVEVVNKVFAVVETLKVVEGLELYSSLDFAEKLRMLLDRREMEMELNQREIVVVALMEELRN
jgi:hypothetical protein